MSDSESKLVIIDTDPGVDDAMAILYLEAIEQVDIHSITTVFGNGSVKDTTRNASFLAETFNLDIPVMAGAAKPLRRERHIPELKVHGGDGFGDTGIATAHIATGSKMDAASHIIETIKSNPHRVTLLALAPLTNLALALQRAPEIENLVAQVVIMGGAFGGSGRNGNIKPWAEANIFYDPEAADIVFAASWPLKIIGLDVTADCILSSKANAELAIEAPKAGKFLWGISQGYEAIYKDFDGIDGCCIHDVAAAVYVAHPEYFVTDSGPVSVDTADGTEGRTRRLEISSERKPHAIAVQVDADRVVSSYTTAIKSLQ